MKEDMEKKRQDIEQEKPVEAEVLTEESPEVVGEAEEPQEEFPCPGCGTKLQIKKPGPQVASSLEI